MNEGSLVVLPLLGNTRNKDTIHQAAEGIHVVNSARLVSDGATIDADLVMGADLFLGMDGCLVVLTIVDGVIVSNSQ